MANPLPTLDCSVRIASLEEDLQRRIQELRRDHRAVAAARARVEAALQSDRVYYGINTGFGALAHTRIPEDQLAQLQENLLISHAVGVGPWLPRPLCQLMLLLKIHTLGLGYSGISVPTFERLLDFAERNLIPAVPSRGSVGASGDLAPLAHMALPLIGHGYFWNDEGTEVCAASRILAKEGLSPIRLQPKDGLSLINGTQLMSACGAYVLKKALHLVKVADILAAMSLEALRGSIQPFDPRIQAVRPYPGQALVAENIRTLLVDSEILESHRHCNKVQDPYCLRCVPQVHGASRDALDYARRVVEIEINAATDNPLVFENGDILSGGNFHGQPLALALDLAAMALAELASISERRTYLLLEGHDGLPRLLMKDTGINSGFMIPQYTAAALVSENKVLCHPASVDSIPTSLGQEDHVSMGSISALKLLNVLENTQHVLAIELFTAAQALDYRLPLRPGRGVALVHQYVRQHVPHREADYFYQQDIARCLAMIQSQELTDLVARKLHPLH